MYISLKNTDMPAFNALLFISALQFLNIGTVVCIINYFLRIDVDSKTASYLALAVGFPLLGLNYILLYSKRDRDFKEFEKMEAKKETKGKIYFWIYVILSITIFFVAVANLTLPK